MTTLLLTWLLVGSASFLCGAMRTTTPPLHHDFGNNSIVSNDYLHLRGSKPTDQYKDATVVRQTKLEDQYKYVPAVRQSKPVDQYKDVHLRSSKPVDQYKDATVVRQSKPVDQYKDVVDVNKLLV